jgi:hypothetical protein
MKKLFVTLVIAIAGLLIPSAASAQCCANPIFTGCFGECGGTEFEGSFTVRESGCFIFCVDNSLCGSTGAIVQVKVGNQTVAAGNFQHGESRTFCAQEGDVITVKGRSAHINTNINCIRQGEVFLHICPQ